MYDLAREGCLHFKCRQCGIIFCGGCGAVFDKVLNNIMHILMCKYNHSPQIMSKELFVIFVR